MLGHVAQSVGGALPVVGGGNGLISQHLSPASVTAPEGATHAFIELQAPGSNTAAGSGFASSGGSATDAIITVSPGDVFGFDDESLRPQTASSQALARRNGQIILSANSNGPSNSPTQAGPSGKYPGGPATSASSPGRGGGRLAGLPSSSGFSRIAPSVGSGRAVTTAGSPTLAGGVGMGCITFFRSYDAALAFANALYGGNWQP